MNFEQYILKGTPEEKEFTSFLYERGVRGPGLENNSYARHDRFLREFMPHIANKIDNRHRHVIDIGFGQGATTHAFSHYFDSIDAFEINNISIEVASARKKIFSINNINFHYSDPENIINNAIKYADNSTVFVLYAVLEHMTEEERLYALSKIWNNMGPDNYLYIGNTPNRLSYEDLHTHEHPFLFSLPDFTCIKYLEMHPEIRYSNEYVHEYRIGGIERFSMIRKRRGLGISYHDFEVAFELSDLNNCVVMSDISAPAKLHDLLLAKYIIDSKINVPMCFAFRDMNFLIKKASDDGDAYSNNTYNQEVRVKFEKIVNNRLIKLCSH